MKRSTKAENYGWSEAQNDLAVGVHPAVVAARLGERVDRVLEVADERGWPVAHLAYVAVSADEILNQFSREFGLGK